MGCLYSSLDRPEGEDDGDGVYNGDGDDIGDGVDDSDGFDNGDGDDDTDINGDQPGGIRGAGPQGQVVPNPRS